MLRLAAIIPVYNEDAEVLDITIREWSPLVDVIIVIDDGSRKAIQVPDTVHLHRLTNNVGQGAALRVGIKLALAEGAHQLITVDGDGQHAPESLSALLKPLINDEVDIVFGSRFLGDQNSVSLPLRRRTMLKAARVFNNWAVGLKMTDVHNGLRAMNRKAADVLLGGEENRMAHASEFPMLIRRSGVRWTEMPVTIRYTRYSMSKGQSWWRLFPLAWQVLRLKIRHGQ
jgi:glycosyltransferase involved in cell wall biosynthesis